MNQIDAGWPESDKQVDIEFENYRKTHGDTSEDDDFVEID
ncbi:hypothetical protein GCM10022277_32980 [Litoribacillus peritrichatus]|uniref:Uncharacterized protein n=1 Tax=Litoribacillus peritrichatus TaxID=718191 RepID=A0ABP7N0N7_9GAMM